MMMTDDDDVMNGGSCSDHGWGRAMDSVLYWPRSSDVRIGSWQR